MADDKQLEAKEYFIIFTLDLMSIITPIFYILIMDSFLISLFIWLVIFFVEGNYEWWFWGKKKLNYYDMLQVIHNTLKVFMKIKCNIHTIEAYTKIFK